MTEARRELAFGLFRASLSAKGLKTTRDIMRLNETLAELTNNFNEYVSHNNDGHARVKMSDVEQHPH